MAIDTFGPNPSDIKKNDQNLGDFKNYISQLKERFSSVNGDIINVNIENLGDYELNFYKKVITFLKSLSVDNCSWEYITSGCKELFKFSKGCSDKQFGPWLNNEITPLFYLDKSDTWAGEGEFNIKSLVESALADIDPENKF